MKTFKIAKHYYNGAISSFATISDSIEFEIKENTIIETIKREYYDEDYNKSVIEGSYDSVENFCEYEREEEKKNYFLDKKDDLLTWAEMIENNYKKDFYKNELPHCLETIEVVIDDKKYIFANREMENDEIYSMPEQILNFHPLIGLPNKLLKKVLLLIMK